MTARVSYLGLIGYGRLFSLACPCRLAREPSDRVWISNEATLVGLTPDGAPEVHTGGTVEDAIIQVDEIRGNAPWELLAPGFFLALPVGFIVMSGTAEAPMPELHLRPADLRGTRTIPDAFISFERRPVDASAARVTGKHAIDELTLAVGETRIRGWEYSYELDGAAWRKRHYALSPGPGVTLMMSAQAPIAEAARMFAATDELAASFAPLRSSSAS